MPQRLPPLREIINMKILNTVSNQGDQETRVKERANCEPWLAVSLSWLIPGFGHFYIKRSLRSVILATVFGILYASLVTSLMWTRCPVLVSGIIFLSFILLPVFVCIDAFKLAKNTNTEEFEAVRKETKDRWSAIFLSLILPGLGYAYLGKYFTFALCLCILFAFNALIESLLLQVVIIWCVCRAFISIHTGLFLRGLRTQKKRTLLLFVAFLTSITLVSKFLLPKVIKHTIVSFSQCLEKSMEPTILSGDLLIVNKLAYAWSEPKVGDIVLINLPKIEPSITTETQIAKRVFAIGGETVILRNGKFVVDRPDDKLDINSYNNLDNTQKERQRNSGDSGTSDWSYTIPNGLYFVIGDNLSMSDDSRAHGPIRGDRIVGKLVKIVWPPSRIRTLKTSGVAGVKQE